MWERILSLCTCLDRSKSTDVLSPDDIKANKPIKFVPNIKRGLVIKVVDGDTIHIAHRLPGNPQIYKFSVRVRLVDCPEIRGKNEYEKKLAIEGREFVKKWILHKIVELHEVDTDKYGRLLAHVHYDSKSLAEELVRRGLARPYDGGARQPWLPK